MYSACICIVYKCLHAEVILSAVKSCCICCAAAGEITAEEGAKDAFKPFVVETPAPHADTAFHKVMHA